jgi:stage II sporulation protein AA (anti-sigma F factor antagonist)
MAVRSEHIEQADRPAGEQESTRRLIGLPDPGGTMGEAQIEHEATVEVRSPYPGVAEIVLGGEHDLGSARKLEDIVAEELTTCSHLVVDLSSVEFIDSSTIKVLVNAKKAASERDCPFNLVLNTTPLVERVLEITDVLDHLNRVHSLEEALQDA